MPTTYEPIATQTLGSAASSITFSSIGSGYTDLRVVFTGTSSSVPASYFMQYNGDTATNYSQTDILGDGSAASSNRRTGQTVIYLYQTVLSPTIPHLTTIDIFSYAGSTFKTCLINGSEDENGSGTTFSRVALWRSTAAITQVSVLKLSGTFNTGTTATLYGIKNA